MNKYIIEGTLVLGFGTALFLSGCASPHYMVTDPHSGNTYYTEQVDNLSGGTVKLKDAKSGSTVTIQNSEVKEISSEEYKKGLEAPADKPAQAEAPTPAAATAPAAAPAPSAAPAAAPTSAPAKAPAPSTSY